ncbi:MAG: MotA/TolQ/ExbB proton channel family protein [Anaeromyxobacteraceae bacterium]|jgi:biopolymer transport protein ExbB/TolQ|nr:MotA/TolQ/ExbB proton channel family protein [Anaeromyxobacteraceae bacterium]
MLTQRFLQLNLLGAEWVNWALVILSIIGLAITVDRLILYARTRERFLPLQAALQDALRRQDLGAARGLVQSDSLVRNVLRAGLEAVGRGERDPKAVEEEMLATLAAERSRYDERVAWLTTIANIAPLVGLLGTIIGVVGAFYGLGQAGTTQSAGNPQVMSSIAEALASTAFGIFVAVPGVVAYNLLKAHMGVRLREAESLMREVLANLGRLETEDGQ